MKQSESKFSQFLTIIFSHYFTFVLFTPNLTGNFWKNSPFSLFLRAFKLVFVATTPLFKANIASVCRTLNNKGTRHKFGNALGWLLKQIIWLVGVKVYKHHTGKPTGCQQHTGDHQDVLPRKWTHGFIHLLG